MREAEWRAMRDLLTLRTRLREALERALMPHGGLAAPSADPVSPAVDVWENETEVVVEVELPTVARDSIDLRLEGDALVVTGRYSPEPVSGAKYLRMERPRGPFSRVVELPAAVDGEPDATLRRGVLEVKLPKAARTRRRVAIQRGSR